MKNVYYEYAIWHIRCTWFIHDVAPPNSITTYMLHVLLVVIPILLPIFPVIMSCVISTRAMFFKVTSPTTTAGHPVINSKSRSMNCHKKRATITIIGVTLLYVIFNLPPSITAIIMLTKDSLMNWDKFFFFNNFQEVYCVALNASLNPLVYIISMKQMQAFIFEGICNAKNIITIHASSVFTPNKSRHRFRMEQHGQRGFNGPGAFKRSREAKSLSPNITSWYGTKRTWKLLHQQHYFENPGKNSAFYSGGLIGKEISYKLQLIPALLLNTWLVHVTCVV